MVRLGTYIDFFFHHYIPNYAGSITLNSFPHREDFVYRIDLYSLSRADHEHVKVQAALFQSNYSHILNCNIYDFTIVFHKRV